MTDQNGVKTNLSTLVAHTLWRLRPVRKNSKTLLYTWALSTIFVGSSLMYVRAIDQSLLLNRGSHSSDNSSTIELQQSDEQSFNMQKSVSNISTEEVLPSMQMSFSSSQSASDEPPKVRLEVNGTEIPVPSNREVESRVQPQVQESGSTSTAKIDFSAGSSIDSTMKARSSSIEINIMSSLSTESTLITKEDTQTTE